MQKVFKEKEYIHKWICLSSVLYLGLGSLSWLQLSKTYPSTLSLSMPNCPCPPPPNQWHSKKLARHKFSHKPENTAAAHFQRREERET